jgi:hypothetical protein
MSTTRRMVVNHSRQVRAEAVVNLAITPSKVQSIRETVKVRLGRLDDYRSRY